jgi:hypothetical protein
VISVFAIIILSVIGSLYKVRLSETPRILSAEPLPDPAPRPHLRLLIRDISEGHRTGGMGKLEANGYCVAKPPLSNRLPRRPGRWPGGGRIHLHGRRRLRRMSSQNYPTQDRNQARLTHDSFFLVASALGYSAVYKPAYTSDPVEEARYH